MAKRPPNNKEIADILQEIGLILEAQSVQFKPRAYQNAAATIRGTDEDLYSLYKECGTDCLDDLPGVGESIAEKIEELLTTGELEYYRELKKEFPVDLLGISAIEGVGSKTAVTLYKELGVESVDELEKAAKAGEVRALDGFGEKTEQNILQGIEFLREDKGRRLIHEARPTAESIVGKLREVDEVTHCDVAGSIRRWKETIGDVDIVLTTEDPQRAKEAFKNLNEVSEVLQEGDTKLVVRYTNGMNGDLRILKSDEYGSGLLYFTGNKDHNVALRKIAIEKGWKLSEYGLFDEEADEILAGKTEQGIYEKLGMDWMPPELRTNQGEIEAAQNGELPDLIGYGDLKGDLQIQTEWTDGAHSIEAMVEKAKGIGLEYIAITDHTHSLAMANGFDDERLLEQGGRIDELNEKYDDFTILKSTECDIQKDGTLDLSDEALKTLDLVCVAVHTNIKMPESQMTERIISAMKNPLVNVLLHPTGRIVKSREPYQVDLDAIMDAAVEYDVALEINASERLDIHDTQIKKALEKGVILTISTDAHRTGHMDNLQYGIAQARRGWATKDDILNTKSVDEMLRALKGE
jgi:DNA polymerase (family 10)